MSLGLQYALNSREVVALSGVEHLVLLPIDVAQGQDKRKLFWNIGMAVDSSGTSQVRRTILTDYHQPKAQNFEFKYYFTPYCRTIRCLVCSARLGIAGRGVW